MGILDQAKTDPNKILPIEYDWAREYYKAGVANNWVPDEVPMRKDIEQWNNSEELSPDERQLIEWNLGFFSTAESLTANNIVLSLYEHITSPECRQYLLRQAYEEAVHTDAFIYCCDSLRLDPDYIYNMYEDIPTIKQKDDFVIDLTETILDGDIRIGCEEDKRSLLRDLIGFYVIMEGIFFYAGFAMMLSMKRRGKMRGIGEQFDYIMRDESLHVGFGIDLINTIRNENPSLWTDEFGSEVLALIREAVKYEKEYASEACPDDINGISSTDFQQYVEYIADRRLSQLNMNQYYDTPNPFPWLSEEMELNKEKNIFERTVTEYKNSGSLDW